MARKSELPLEQIKLRLFLGDFARLGSILSARRVPPTLFIRHLVRQTITKIEAKANLQAKPVEIDPDDIIQLSRTESAIPGEG